MSRSPSTTFAHSRRSLAGYVVLCLIWGSTWLAIRVVVSDAPPLEASAIRFVIAGVFLLGVALVQKRRWPRGERAWNGILVLSITIMAVPYGLLFWAEQHVTSSMAALLFSSMPLLVALFTPAMTGHKVPRSAVFALVVAFGAVLVLFYRGLSASRIALWGGAAVLTAMLLSAWSVVYAKSRLQEVDSVIATGLQLLFGSVALGWGTWALEANRHAHWTPASLMALAFLTVFGSCVAFVVYYWLLKKMQPYQLATTSLVVPVIAVAEGALFARERIPLTMIGAMAVLLVSVGSVLRMEAGAERQVDILMLRSKTP